MKKNAIENATGNGIEIVTGTEIGTANVSENVNDLPNGLKRTFLQVQENRGLDPP